MSVEPTPSRDDGRSPPDRGPERPAGGGPAEDDGFDPFLLAAAIAVAALVTAIGLYAFKELEPPVLGLGLVAATGLGTLYLAATKRHPAEAIGSGLYVASGLLVFTPFLLYIPKIALQGESIRLTAQNVTASNVSIGGGGSFFQAGGVSAGTVTSGDVDSLIGLVVFIVIFLLLGLVTMVLGRLAKSYASSKIEAQRTSARRR